MSSTTLAKTLISLTLTRRPSHRSLTRRFSSVPTITRPPTLPITRPGRPALLISDSARSLAPFTAIRLNTIRCRVNRSGPYSPLNNNSGGSNFSDRPPTEIAPLFPGCDYEHWLIVMEKPDEDKQRMIDVYVDTLSKVVGSKEEAIKRMYNVSCDRYFGFGCEVDEETANKMEGLPGVLFVLPDSYVDPENKDYGAELFVNGEIVQRSPERQRRVEPVAPRHGDRPRYSDRTRYQRRRENMR